MAKYKSQNNVSSVSCDGVEYVADENGLIDAPQIIAGELVAFGLEIVEFDEVPAPAEESAPEVETEAPAEESAKKTKKA